MAIPVADRRNMAYSGTLVTTGSGAGIVVATGVETELGEIHRLVGAAETLATPLTQKLAGFSKILTAGILALAAVTFGVGVLWGQDTVETFTAAIALAVGAIPEGLPAAVTITPAIGVHGHSAPRHHRSTPRWPGGAGQRGRGAGAGLVQRPDGHRRHCPNTGPRGSAGAPNDLVACSTPAPMMVRC
jgi:hypothetical protein